MIAERLRLRREELNYAQGAFLPQTTLSQWEGGAVPRAFEQLALLVEKYVTSADYLLGLTADPAPVPLRGGR